MSIQISKIETSRRAEPWILGIKVDGKLTVKDYEGFVPQIEALMKKGRIRILLELVDFHGWTAGAIWEDTKFTARHFSDIERIAIVGNKKWEKGMASFCKPFTAATIRYFDSSEIENAKEWIMAGQEQSEMSSKAAK